MRVESKQAGRQVLATSKIWTVERKVVGRKEVGEKKLGHVMESMERGKRKGKDGKIRKAGKRRNGQREARHRGGKSSEFCYIKKPSMLPVFL